VRPQLQQNPFSLSSSPHSVFPRMSRIRLPGHIGALLLFAASSAVADQLHAQVEDLTAGAKVRVVAPALWATRYEATIGARRGDTLSLVRQNAAVRDVPLSAATRVDLALGRSRRAGALRGIVWGAGIGAVLGLLNASGYGVEPASTCRTMTCGSSKIADGGTLVLGGILYGVGIGALVRRETWRTVISRPAREPQE
jgi:hypothetical protein